MQLKLNTREVTRSDNLGEAQAFRVVAGAKMFHVLSNSLYSDKPLAVCREYCCNALDAHAMSGQPRPFEVRLPTKWSPALAIRDYGPGLSHADVVGLFTTFFESTKASRNDAVGAFGLGSKSAFAYTDMFSVTSSHGGERRAYLCSKDEQGIPKIDLMGAEPSDETGLEIEVAIKSEDFARFSSALAQVLRDFPEGSWVCDGVKPRPREFWMEGSCWGLQWDPGPDPVAIMGPVAYPIDGQQIWGKSYRSEDYRGLVLRFPMGALDLMPSREGLSYDQSTIEAIRAAFARCKAEVLQIIEDDLQDCLSHWTAQWVFMSNLHKLRVIPALGLHLVGTWNGRDLQPAYTILPPEPGREFATYTRESLGKAYPKAELHAKLHFGSAGYTMARPSTIFFVYNDLTTHRAPKLMQRLKSRFEDEDKLSLLVLYPGDGCSFEAFCASIGNPPEEQVFKLSDLEAPSTSTAHLKTGKAMAYKLYPSGQSMRSVELDTRMGGFYVPADGAQVSIQLQKLAGCAMFKNCNIYALPKRFRKEYDISSFTPLLDHALEIAKKAAEDPWVLDFLAARDLQVYSGNTLLRLALREKAVSSDPVWTHFRAQCKRVAQAWSHEHKEKAEVLSHLLDQVKPTLPSMPDLKAEIEHVTKKRPLLTYIASNVRHIQDADIGLIMQSLNKQRGMKHA